MRRRDLSQPAAKMVESIGQAISRARNEVATSHHGVKDLGSDGDTTWTDQQGDRHSIRRLPDDITRIEGGLATVTRANTVSTVEPTNTGGYPSGAFWTQVGDRGGKLVVVGTWQLVAGTWQPVAEDASRLVTGQIDVGLLDAAMVGARLVETGALATPADQDGYSALVDSRGFTVQRSMPDGGSETLARLGPENENYLTIGESVIRPDRIASPTINSQNLTIGSQPLTDVIRDTSHLVALAQRQTKTEWRQSPTELLEINIRLERGRVYRIDASPITGEIDSKEQHWARMSAELLMREADMGAPAGYDSSCVVAHTSVWVPPQNVIFTTPSISIHVDTRDWTANRIYSILLAIKDASSGQAIFAASYALSELAIYDLGAPCTDSAVKTWIWTEHSAIAAGNNFGFDIEHQDAASYWGASGMRDNDYPGQAISGTRDNEKNLREGVFSFGDVRSVTAGAIGKARIEIRCDYTHDHAGGYVDVWALTNHQVTDNKPTGITGLIASHVRVQAGRISGVDVPPQMLGLIRSGQLNAIMLSATGRTDPAWHVRCTKAWLKGQYTS